jgi:DNA repair exonuclease SbcCD ATPase subunit
MDIYLYDREYNLWRDSYLRLEEDIANKATQENPYSRQIDEENLRYQQEKENLEETVKRRDKLTKEYDILSYLKWVMSREGVVSFIIENAFSRLQMLANKYLTSMTNSQEAFQIVISPQRELKSGDFREEIDIQVFSKGNRIPYWGLSDGQRQRVNISLLFAVYFYCKGIGINKFDFILLDEVCDISLDGRGQEDVLRLLDNLRVEIKQIVVISHRDTIASNFDYEVKVRQPANGGSVIA